MLEIVSNDANLALWSFSGIALFRNVLVLGANKESKIVFLLLQRNTLFSQSIGSFYVTRYIRNMQFTSVIRM